MNNHTILTTRKIQLIINSSDKAYIADTYKTLHSWQYTCFRAANYINTHYFVQEQLKDFFYLTDNLQLKLGDIHKDANGMFTTSKMNTTYQLLSKHFKGEIPMHIISSLNMTLAKHFNNERLAYAKGEKALPNYKRTIPIPFKGTDVKALQKMDTKNEYSFSLFQIPFRTYLGSDKYDKRELMDNLLSGSIRLRTSALQLDKQKIFWLATFETPKEEQALDATVIAEASLSMDHPIILKIGKARFIIGTKEEFLYGRLAIQTARQRVQKAVTYCRPQHGRNRKLKALDHYHDKEKNYVHQKLHLYSRRLINLCIQYRAASLILTNQTAKEAEAINNDFILRNWSYYALKEKIAYKANKAGIQLITE